MTIEEQPSKDEREEETETALIWSGKFHWIRMGEDMV